MLRFNDRACVISATERQVSEENAYREGKLESIFLNYIQYKHALFCFQ
jgi:hypothetical protein